MSALAGEPSGGGPGERETERETAFDLARAIAIVLMVLVNFQLMLARPPPSGGAGLGEQLLRWLVHVPSGRSSSLFVVLSGVGFSLLTRRARESGDRIELRVARRTLLLRAGFLFVLGNLLHVVWSIDILHFYACYLLLAALFFVRLPDRALLGVAIGVTLLGAALELLLPERAELPFLSPEGMALDALVDGVHPVVPWLAFVAYGAWLGRRDLGDPVARGRLLRGALLVVVLTELGSLGLAHAVTRLPALAPLRAHLGLFSTGWTPDPLYVLSASGTATVVITLAHEVVAHARWGRSLAVRALISTGQLALSLYLAHALVGVVIPRWTLGLGHALSVAEVTAYWAAFVILAIVSAALYRRLLARGPLEWVMRRLTTFRLASERAAAPPAPKPRAQRESPRDLSHLDGSRAVWVVVGAGAALLLLARALGLPAPHASETALAPGEAQLGALSLLRMRAEHPLILERARTLVLETHSGADLYLELDSLAADGTPTRVAEDDDGGDGLDARLVATLAPGSYRVVVRPFAATTGPYVLEVRDAP